MPNKSTKSQKELFFERLALQQQQQQQEEAKQQQQPQTTGSARPNNTEDKTTGVYVNQGVFHPSLGVIALSYGMDSGYIARKLMKFRNTTGELSEGQQLLAARQAVSQAYTDLLQEMAITMMESGTRELEITPENIMEITEDKVIINLFNKYQLGATLVNTNVERDDGIEVDQTNLANLFA